MTLIARWQAEVADRLSALGEARGKCARWVRLLSGIGDTRSRKDD